MAFFTGMKFFSRLRLSASGRLGRPHANARRFIFLYHRIASPAHDPFALSVGASQFQDHLDILRSHCQMVALDELLETQEVFQGVVGCDACCFGEANIACSCREQTHVKELGDEEVFRTGVA